MVQKSLNFNKIFRIKLKRDIHVGSSQSVSFIDLFKFAACREKFLIGIALLASTITGIAATVNALNFCTLSDAMILYGSLRANETTQYDKAKLKEAIITFAINDGLVVASFIVFKYISITAFNYTACTQVLRMRGLLFKSALNWDMSWYDMHESGELASRINEDLAKLEDGIGEKIPMYFHYIVAFMSSLGISFFYGWELALVCVAPVPIVIGCMMFMSSNTVKQTQKGIDAYAQAGVSAEEVLSSIRTIHAFEGKEKEVQRYKVYIGYARKVIQKREFFSALLSAFQWLCMFSLNGLGFSYGVRLLVRERHLAPEDITYNPRTMLIV